MERLNRLQHQATEKRSRTWMLPVWAMDLLWSIPALFLTRIPVFLNLMYSGTGLSLSDDAQNGQGAHGDNRVLVGCFQHVPGAGCRKIWDFDFTPLDYGRMASSQGN